MCTKMYNTIRHLLFQCFFSLHVFSSLHQSFWALLQANHIVTSDDITLLLPAVWCRHRARCPLSNAHDRLSSGNFHLNRADRLRYHPDLTGDCCCRLHRGGLMTPRHSLLLSCLDLLPCPHHPGRPFCSGQLHIPCLALGH